MSKGREKLQPWLEKKLDSGTVQGVEWINKNVGTFQILWKRNTATRSNEDDFQIFKDWAKHTGRYAEGETTKYPYWKSLFRNALNKQSNIEEKKEEYSNKNNNCPYRVFQIKDYKPYMQPQGCFQDMNVNNNDMSSYSVPTLLTEFNDVVEEEEEEMEISLLEPPPENHLTSFTVTVKVGSQTECREGNFTSCVIKTGCYMDGSLTSDNILRLQLDSLSRHPRGKKLIDGLSRGIKIYIDNEMNIIAERSCQCRVFYISQMENQESKNLERNKPEKIFDFRIFTELLNGKLHELTKFVPQCDIFMSVGQRCYQDLNSENGILLSITVTSHLAEEYLKQHNLKAHNSIQMSEPDSVDRKCSEIIKIKEEFLST
ncbi:interferon regulatory factor 1 [Octopus sinensis]|uniref:Interferon regulatory factor 1 n=1 Tax=Octopus sinensis TaxID=2607531 RepID=A0A6P7SZC6_9MOLL|nr:interferon regulatory factor 1 [Octopus sinensis]XP_029643525.1 interferon regulatory factor 1 [Octopus sinensis]XP_036356903.1 interferon regulatory factor 1 [Octopus sinensis]